MVACSGFVVADTGRVAGGSGTAELQRSADTGCTPAWGGAYGLDAAATGIDLDRRIADFRDHGGDIVVSFGALLTRSWH